MRTERGFALLEVLIAFAIAAAALGVLFQAASNGGGAVRSAGQYEEAVSRAKSHMAALDQDALSEHDASGDDGGGYRWHIKITPVAAVKPVENTAPDAARPTLYAIEVGISWAGNNRRREVVLRSQRLGKGKGLRDG